MSRRKPKRRAGSQQGRSESKRLTNASILAGLMCWLIPKNGLFSKAVFHGNIKWSPEQLAQQAVLWAWQETKHVTDAFTHSLQACTALGLTQTAKTYTAFVNALDRYAPTFTRVLQCQFQKLAKEVAGWFGNDKRWFLMAFDGSRATVPRTVSNEKEFCAANYGNGKTALYRRKKSKGMRRRNNEENKPQPQTPQIWITMFWQMNLRLPWTWLLGPSNSSERGHVMRMMEEQSFPENTLFCGDAGFVGYDFWDSILDAGHHFLVRVGGNVKLISRLADVQRRGGEVLCWPKTKMNSGAKPLRLRLVRVKVGKTKMWMLTSILSRQELTRKMIVRYYKMRWGVEVEFRGLKQTIDKRKLQCRNSARAYVELDWSIRAMAFIELIALREQIKASRKQKTESDYDPKQRSLANSVRALRDCTRKLHEYAVPGDDLLTRLSEAKVQKYTNRTSKKARYRPNNPDKKPLGDPVVEKISREQRAKLREIDKRLAA